MHNTLRPNDLQIGVLAASFLHGPVVPCLAQETLYPHPRVPRDASENESTFL